MIIEFDKDYLRELYTEGRTNDKKERVFHRNGNLLGKPFICSKITVTTLLAMPYFVKSKNL